MGYRSEFSGEVVITGLFLHDLGKFGITAEADGSRLAVICGKSSTGFYLDNPEPTGFRVVETPSVITLYPGEEPENGYGFSDLVSAVVKLWRKGHIQKADLRRVGEERDDLEHYFLRNNNWRKVKVIEKTVNWRPKPCPR